MIDLYTSPTPNGHKASCTLEELGIPYVVHPVNLMEGDQKTDAFLAMNPNGRVPTLQDGDFVLWESHTILRYLAGRHGGAALLPQEPRRRAGDFACLRGIGIVLCRQPLLRHPGIAAQRPRLSAIRQEHPYRPIALDLQAE